MTTKTFGRRTAVPRGLPRDLQPARVAAAPAASIAAPSEPSAFDEIFRDNPLLNDLPYLTVGLIALLALIFWAETRFAFDIAKGGNLSVQSLIAFGAVSRDLVIGSGQWWRIGLAPLLHASISHIVGNSVALFFVGLRLEPMIGRRWFILVFVASGLGGVIGSLCGNLPGLPSVGASGAITGLVAALFVMSFTPYATTTSSSGCARRRCASACRRSCRSRSAPPAMSTISPTPAARSQAARSAWSFAPSGPTARSRASRGSPA